MMKARTTLNAPTEALVECITNVEERRKWDPAIADFKVFFSNEDSSMRRQTFNFKSPVPLITSDRDFYIISLIRRDFPEKGDIAIFQKSLPEHPEYPPQSGKVRAHMHIVGFVYRPVKDEHGNEVTEVFMVNSVDIGGWVPTALVNTFSASVPRQQFDAHTRGTLEYIKKKE